MDLFRTTADTGANSFQDPLNPFNTTQGAWNIDQTYLTPSYAAPYRPQYQGPQGAPPPNQNVGFGTSLYNVFTPFGQSHMYGNGVEQDDPYYSSLAYRPVDTAAWGLQRGVIPALALAAGMKAGSLKVASNNAIYSGVKGAWANGWSDMSHGRRMAGGMTAEASEAMRSAEYAKNAYAASRMGLGARIGSSIGMGAARGVTGGLSAAGLGSGTGLGATAFAESAGIVGAGLGSLALPLVIGEGISRLADAAIFDPYAATRIGERSLRRNFSNVMAGTGANGNSILGTGMSREFASGLSSRLTKASIHDRTFDTYGMNDLTDLAARGGMLDDTQIEQVESRMKKLAKQIKVMMRVANEPDFRAAMEMMSELKIAGVNTASAGKVLQNIGGSAAIAGISVQKMMNTVGAQGQYIYQSNNLAPYVGQVQAASTYGAFSSAYRMGLVSDSTMAKFGGREGATQLAVTGQVNAAQTPYNQIMLMNETFNKGNKGNVVGNVASFGQMAAGDPLGAAGAMGLYDSEMTSKQLMQKGPGAVLDQIKQISQVIPGMTNKDGKVDVEKAFLLLTRQMGLPPMEAKAMLKELQVYGDQGSRDNMTAALQSNMKKDTMKYLEQEGLGGGVFNRVSRPLVGAWKDLKAGGAGVVGDVLEGAGKVGDGLEGWVGGARFGSLTKGLEAKTFDEFTGSGDKTEKSYELKASKLDTAKKWLGRHPLVGLLGGEYKLVTGGKELLSDNTGSVDSINRLVKTGDKDARIASDPNSSKEARKTALDNLNADKKLDRFLSPEELDSFTESVLDGGTSEIEGGVTTKADKVNKGLKDSLGKDVDMLSGIGLIDAARKVSTGEGDKASEDLLRKTYGDSMSRTALVQKATEVYKSAADNGVVHLASMLNGKTPEELEKAARAGSTDEFGSGAKDLQAKIREIDGSDGSDEERKKKVSEAVTFARSKNTGVGFAPVLDPKILSKDVSPETIAGALESSKETSKKTQQINTLASQGVINFDTKYSSLAALDLTKAVDSFGAFVKALDGTAGKFSDAVDNMGGKKTNIVDWFTPKNPKASSTGNP